MKTILRIIIISLFVLFGVLVPSLHADPLNPTIYEKLQFPWYDYGAGATSAGCTVDVGANFSGNENAEIAFNFFVSQGFTPIQAAGIIGNLMRESHVNPKANQSGGPGMGIAQWSENERWQTLLTWANKEKKDPLKLETQLQFIMYEFNNGYEQVMANVKKATTIEDATLQFMGPIPVSGGGAGGGYENPGIPAYDERVAFAKDAHEKYAAGAGSVATTPAGSSNNCIGTTSSGQPTQFTSDDFPIYSQYDPRWANKPYGTPGKTVASSGCGPAAMAMIITALTGLEVTPDVVADYADENGMYVPGAGSSWLLPSVVAPHWGLKASLIGADISKINATLQAGGLVITSGQGPEPFTSGGHYIVIRGVTADGTWLIGDSAHNDTSDKKWDPKELIANMNGGSVYAVSK